MKVLYIVTAYDRHPGDGITPWLVETIRRLRERGVDVEVLAPAYRGSESGTVEGVRVHRFRYAPARVEDLTHDQTAPDRVRERPLYLGLVPGYLLSASLAARRLVRSGAFDLVHVHWPLPHVVPGWAARHAGGIPLVITFHGVEVTFARNAPLPFLVPFLRRAIRSADAVTANSTYTAGMIRQLYDRPVAIVPFGTTLPEADDPPGDPSAERSPAPAAQDPGARPDILFVGRLVERKGVQHLLDAMPALVRDHRAQLSVVGEGPMRPALERRAAELGLQDDVTFTGFVPADDLARRFATCSAFALPAVYDAKGDVEGLGVVLVEALSQGRPVVASDAGGIPDIVIHDRTGLLVPPGDPAALSAALGRVLGDPALARRLGEAGREHVREAFSWASVTDRLLAVYEAVLQR